MASSMPAARAIDLRGAVRDTRVASLSFGPFVPSSSDQRSQIPVVTIKEDFRMGMNAMFIGETTRGGAKLTAIQRITRVCHT